jgi:hypothetical protein
MLAGSELAMMMMVFCLGVSVGVTLGLRFKVFILLPAIIAGVALVEGASIVFEGHFRPTLLAVVLSTVGLQLGFVAGICASHFLVLGRPRETVPRPRPAASGSAS